MFCYNVTAMVLFYSVFWEAKEFKLFNLCFDLYLGSRERVEVEFQKGDLNLIQIITGNRNKRLFTRLNLYLQVNSYYSIHAIAYIVGWVNNF